MPELHPFVTRRWKNHNYGQFEENEWFISENQNSFVFAPNRDIKSIFLGSFPTTQVSIDEPIGLYPEFFYGSPQNNFWTILGHLSDLPSATFQNRIDILRRLKIGIADILLEVERNGNYNDDKNLHQIRYNNILDLLLTFPNLENIFMTSGGKAPIYNLNNNNPSVATWLRHSLVNHNFTGFNQNGYLKAITNNDVTFNLISLASPSKNADRSFTRSINNINRETQLDLTVNDYRKLSWSLWLKKLHFTDNDTPQPIQHWSGIAAGNNYIQNHFEN